MTLSSVKPWHVAIGATALVALFVALWPLGLGRDYMNHLARTYIEGHLASDPVLQQYYGLSFDLIPDLTMDMIIPWLSHIIGIYPAGAVTVWLAFVLPPLAGVALAKTLHGRVTWLSLLGFLTVFNANMDWGFVNYTASSGLALFAFVLWVRMAPSWLRTLVFAPISLFLVVNHALAFLTFGFLVFVWEVVSFYKQDRGSLRAFILQLGLKDFPAMLSGLVFLYLSMQSVSDLPQDVAPLYNIAQKARTLIAATEFGNLLLAFAAALAIIAFVWVAVRSKWLAFAEKTDLLCAAFLGLVVLVPTAIFGIWGLHLRFVAPLVIVFGACVTATPNFSPRARQISGGALGLVAALLFANGALQLATVDRQSRILQALLADVPVGAKVFSSISSLEVAPAFTPHAVSMAVIERSAFVPSLFTNTSPVDIVPGMADWHMPQARLYFDYELSKLVALPPEPSKNGYWSEAYAYSWHERWDYLIYFKHADEDGLSDVPVCEVKSTPQIILYATGACARD